jgi:hypothetical protein
MKPTPVQISKHFGIDYRLALRWSYAPDTNWRRKLYEYLEKRYIIETLEAMK